MKFRLYMHMHNCLFFITAFIAIAENRGTIQYANIDDTVVLKCKVIKGAEDLRWRRNNFILTDGQKINKEIPWFRKSKIDIETDKSQYNLLIANVTAADFGLYLCEMQINKEMSRHKVTLEYKGNL